MFQKKVNKEKYDKKHQRLVIKSIMYIGEKLLDLGI